MMKLRFSLLGTAFMLLCMTNGRSQAIINLNGENTELKLKSASQEFFEEAKTSRVFAINPALQSASSVVVGDIVLLQLFESKNYTAIVSSAVSDVNGNFTLTLKLPDYPMGFAIITTNQEGKSLVNVSIPELGTSFGSRYGVNTNGFYLIEIDESKMERHPIEDDAIPVPKEIPVSTKKEKSGSEPCVLPPTVGGNMDSTATITLLVVYSPAAENSSYASSHGGINNIIASMAALSNLCFSNSQTGIILQVVHSEQVVYTETNNLSLTLDRMKNSSDGYMDTVHILRRIYKADLVQLLSLDNEPGVAGRGYLLSDTAGDASSGFSAVNVTQVGDGYPSSIHEIGHNMGLGHGANMTTSKFAGIFPYSEGWDWVGSDNVKYCSVMGYTTGYPDGQKRTYVPYFSNPNVSYMGAATGDAARADAARSLRELKHIIAYYKITSWGIGYPNICDVIATLHNDTLTISVTGDMKDFDNPYAIPWRRYRDNIKTVIIDYGVTSIGEGAFMSCSNLTSVTIPNSVISIETIAFFACSKLTTVTIPNSVTSIGMQAFSQCDNLTSITISENVTSLGRMAFGWSTKLHTVNYNAVNATIVDNDSYYTLFRECPLTTVNIGSRVETIPDMIFYDCSDLTSVIIPNSVIAIGDESFKNCSRLASITIPNSVKTIGRSAFENCTGVNTVTIGKNLTSAGNSAFRNCTALKTVIYNAINCTTGSFGTSALTTLTIGSEVKSIPDAFSNCTNLTSITCKAVIPPTLTVFSFFVVPTAIPVYIPCQSYNRYTSATYWKNFTNFVSSLTDTTFYTAVKCKNTPYTDGNFTKLTQAGNYYRTFNISTGCDSVVCLMLIELTTPNNVTLEQLNNRFFITWQGNATSYQIYRNNNLLATVNTTAYTDTNLTIGVNYCYKIKAIDGGCESEFSNEVCKKNVGIAEMQCVAPLRVYPNPTNGLLTIDIGEWITENVNYYIYSTVGQMVMQGHLQIQSIGYETSIDVSHLATGMYFLRIGHQTTRFMKK